MKITPILTEKSLKEAKKGYYSFWVDKGLTKLIIKRLVDQLFGVHSLSVKTLNYKRLAKRNFKGKTEIRKALKKAVVGLKAGEKIALFEEKGKK